MPLTNRPGVEAVSMRVQTTALAGSRSTFFDTNTRPVDVAAHAPDWASFRYLASRHLQAYGIGTPEAVEEFIEGVPEMLSETVRHVGRDRIQAFLDRSRSGTLQAIKDYLS